MVPAEGSFVDFRQRESPSLVWLDDVGKVIVEVVVGSIAPGRLC